MCIYIYTYTYTYISIGSPRVRILSMLKQETTLFCRDVQPPRSAPHGTNTITINHYMYICIYNIYIYIYILFFVIFSLSLSISLSLYTYIYIYIYTYMYTHIYTGMHARVGDRKMALNWSDDQTSMEIRISGKATCWPQRDLGCKLLVCSA